MNAQTYAQALFEATKDVDADTRDKRYTQFVQALKRRGHESLLPAILGAYERVVADKHQGTTLTIAREKDESAAKEALKKFEGTFDSTHYKTIIDDSIIGGFIARTEDKVLDQSWRSALIGLYQKVTQ